jgi:hypothetical protein
MVRAAKTEASAERRQPRERAFLQAKLSFADGAVSFPCMAVQISSTGAKLAVDDSVSAPDRFQIEIPQRGIDCPARMVWRRKGHIAVAFEQPDVRPPEPWDASLARLRELEAENEKLRASLLALTEQVSRITDTY